MPALEIEFTQALKNNIERTYTYSFVKNMGHDVSVESYDAVSWFCDYIKTEPFKAFMGLERHGFKNTKKALDRYGIPYTEEQERRAKVFTDVTERMQKEKSDIVHMPEITDIQGTGIVKHNDGLTTSKTVRSHETLNNLPRNKKTSNLLYKNKLPKMLLDSKEQLAAVDNCLTHQVSCLIGGAGTGKSFVTANIVDQLKYNNKRVVILAPTHKAKDALQQKLSKGSTVRTIHSFIHTQQEPSDAIVIDEAGMLSTPLFVSLMKRVEDQQIIFVGDKNQLAPIEYGRPFEKIMKLFSTYELKQNRRSESPDIVALGRAVIDEPFNQNISFESNIHHVSSIQEAFKLGADVILTFRNNDVDQINEIRRIKNGTPAICPKFSVGDSVVAKTNTQKFTNGQFFTIIDRDVLKAQDGRRVSIRSEKELEYNFELAYGLTIHKSQGSEWESVAYMPSNLDTRNLAYVAITRARKKLIIIGELQGNLSEDKEWQQLN